MRAHFEVCKILCFAGPIRTLSHTNLEIHSRTRMQGLVGAFCNARWIPGIQRAAGAELIDYMTLRAAAVANLHSNQDAIKLPSEVKESS